MQSVSMCYMRNDSLQNMSVVAVNLKVLHCFPLKHRGWQMAVKTASLNTDTSWNPEICEQQ